MCCRENVVASAAIQPAFSDFLNSGSKFVLEEAELSQRACETCWTVVTGNLLTLVPGEGENLADLPLSARTNSVRKKSLLRFA
ncbi:hypothetical protein O9992_19525 [Vibrio lentus]|nr:hypothetical protein [Vibrio lentus]